MHAHALRKEGQRQRWVVEGGGVCACFPLLVVS